MAGDSRRYPAPNTSVTGNAIPEATESAEVDSAGGFIDENGTVRPVLGSEKAPYAHGGLPRKSEVLTFSLIPEGEPNPVQIVDYTPDVSDLEFTEEIDVLDWRTLTLLVDYQLPASLEGLATDYALGLVLELTADANPANARWYPYPTIWDSNLWQRPSGAYSASFYMRQALSTLYLTPNLNAPERVGSVGTNGLIRLALPFDVEPFRMARVGFRQGVYVALGTTPETYRWDPAGGNPPAFPGAATLRYQLSF